MATINVDKLRINITGSSKSFDDAAKRAARAARNLQRRQYLLSREFGRARVAAASYAQGLVSLRGAIAVLGGSAGLGAIVTQSAQYAGAFLRTADGAGVLTETLFALRRVAGESNISIELFDSAILKLRQRISEAVDGQKNAIDGFKALGVSATDAEGNVRSFEEILNDFIQGLAKAGPAAIARARFVFEETSSQIVPGLVNAAKHGSELAEAYQRATDPSREMLEQAKALGVQFGDLREDIKNVGVRISADVAGPWSDLIGVIRSRLPQAMEGMSSILTNVFIPAMRYLAENTAGAGAAFLGFGAAMSRLGAVLAATGGLIIAQIDAAKKAAATVERIDLFSSHIKTADKFMDTLRKSGRAGKALWAVMNLLKASIKGVAAAMWGLTKAMSAFLLKFAIFSVAFQLFTQPDVVINNIKRVGTALVDVLLAAGSTISAFFERMWDGVILYIVKRMRDAFEYLAGGRDVNPAGGTMRVGEGRGAWARSLAKETPFDEDSVFGKAAVRLNEWIELIENAQQGNSNLAESLKELGTAFKNLLLGIDSTEAGETISPRERLSAFQRNRRMEINQADTSDMMRRANRSAAKELKRFLDRQRTDREGILADQRARLRMLEANFKDYQPTTLSQALANTERRNRADARLSDRFKRIMEETPLANAGPQIDPELLATRQGALRDFGGTAVQAMRAYDDLQKKMERNRQMLSSMESSFESFFESIIDGTMKAGDAFKALAAEIARAVLRATIIQPIANAITGGIQSFFSIRTPTGSVTGGTAHAGRPYLVGEAGPELFMPSESGRIVANRNMGGGDNFSFVFNIESTDGPGVQRALAQARPLLQQDAVEAVAQANRRPGGIRG